MKLQELLKSYREQHGYTQEELASLLYVSRQAVSKWERGEATPDIDNIIRLSDIYDISIDELIRGSRFFPKPFKVGEQSVNVKVVGLTILSFVLTLSFLSIGVEIFLIMFLILELSFLALIKEGNWLFTRKGVEVTYYKNVFERLLSIFRKGKYTKLYEYKDIDEFQIIYKALKRNGPFDFKPDYFNVRLKVNGIKHDIEVWPKLQNDLPMLCDYLNRQGVVVRDEHNIIEMIVKNVPIYETIHNSVF